jgi:hypothetical protein
MKATCPKDPEHKEFYATAHVAEEWIVDETGQFLDHADLPGEVTHAPGPDDVWTCKECGAEAVVTES